MKILNFSALIPLVCAGLLTAFCLPAASATEYTWSSTDTSRNWSDATNWSPTGGPPGASDSVTLGIVNDWGARINVNVTVANIITDSSMAYAFDLLPASGNGNSTTLTITDTLLANGGTKMLTIRGDEVTNSKLYLNVNNISVTNQTVRLGAPYTVGAGGQRRELAGLTSTGVTTLGTGGVLMLNVASDATLGNVRLNGGTLILANEDPSATNISRTLTVTGLDGTAGTILTAASGTAYSGSSTLNASDVRTGILKINTAESEHHVLGGTSVIADKSSGVVGTVTLAVVKQGKGIQELSGANTYSGGTTVTEGTLLVTNASSSTSATGTGAVVVETSGVLAGNGYIGGAVSSNGHLSPGGITGSTSEAGILTINNTLSLGAGTVLDFDLSTPNVAGGTGGNDLISVLGTTGSNGDVTISGVGTLSLLSLGVSVSDGVYQLVSFTGTLTGASNLSSWTVDGLLSTQSAVFDYSSNSIFVTISSVPEPTTVFSLLSGLVVLAFAVRNKKLRII